MDLRYLIFIIAFLGVFIGIYLEKILKKEVKDYQSEILGLKISLLMIIAISFFLFIKLSLINVLLLVLGIILSKILKVRFFYLSLALIMAFLIHPAFFIIVACSIFAYGIFYGSLHTDKWHISLVFYLIPLFLLFYPNYILEFKELFISFISGASFTLELPLKA